MSGELGPDFTHSLSLTRVQRSRWFSVLTHSQQQQIFHIIQARGGGGVARCSRQRQEVTYYLDSDIGIFAAVFYVYVTVSSPGDNCFLFVSFFNFCLCQPLTHSLEVNPLGISFCVLTSNSVDFLQFILGGQADNLEPLTRTFETSSPDQLASPSPFLLPFQKLLMTYNWRCLHRQWLQRLRFSALITSLKTFYTADRHFWNVARLQTQVVICPWGEMAPNIPLSLLRCFWLLLLSPLCAHWNNLGGEMWLNPCSHKLDKWGSLLDHCGNWHCPPSHFINPRIS